MSNLDVLPNDAPTLARDGPGRAPVEMGDLFQTLEKAVSMKDARDRVSLEREVREW